jgi:hypothetical protein
MSRKDFIAFAAALRATEPSRQEAEGAGDYLARRMTWGRVRAEMMRVMAQSNPAFDPERFMRASEREVT